MSPLRVDAYAPGEVIGDKEFVIVRDFVAEGEYAGRAGRFVVSRGFISDFASIPTPLHVVPGFHPNGKSRPAAVLHDFLYSMAGRVKFHILRGDKWAPVEILMDRRECDIVFYEALLATGSSVGASKAMLAGVRAAGWRYWNHRSEGAEIEDFVDHGYWTRTSGLLQ